MAACLPDSRGFWQNCPAVGCILRAEPPPGRPPRGEVIRRLCVDARTGGGEAGNHLLGVPEPFLPSAAGSFVREGRAGLLTGLARAETLSCRDHG